MDESAELSKPKPSPAFREHFTDPVYFDEGGEFAPFGTDEGWDILYDWAARRDQLTDASTIAQILEMTEAEIDQELSGPEGEFQIAPIVVGAGFTLLYLTGQINPADKALTIRELDVLIDRYGPEPELLRQRTDLDSWPH